MSWSRRVGVAGALLILVGGSIAFASQALDPGAGSPRAPQASIPRPPAPTLLNRATSLTRAAAIDLTLIAPSGLRRDQEYTVRLYVNDELVRERRLPDQAEVQLASVPLDEGENAVRAALVGAGGEGDRSAEVTVLRDSSAPIIRVTSPEAGITVYGETTTLRGRTEPGADISIVDQLTGQALEAVIDADGRFSAELSLAVGSNPLLLRSQDEAGNQARARIAVVRARSEARLRLDVSAGELLVTDLPILLEMVATVRDELGRPADGVEVTFGLSPPNAATRTFRTTTLDGLATWPDLEIVDDGYAVGTWLVTVRAVLTSGAELREDRSFSVQ